MNKEQTKKHGKDLCGDNYPSSPCSRWMRSCDPNSSVTECSLSSTVKLWLVCFDLSSLPKLRGLHLSMLTVKKHVCIHSCMSIMCMLLSSYYSVSFCKSQTSKLIYSMASLQLKEADISGGSTPALSSPADSSTFSPYRCNNPPKWFFLALWIKQLLGSTSLCSVLSCRWVQTSVYCGRSSSTRFLSTPQWTLPLWIQVPQRQR